MQPIIRAVLLAVAFVVLCIAALAVAGLQAPARGQTGPTMAPCAPLADRLAELQAKYAEALLLEGLAADGTRLMITVNPDGTTWTAMTVDGGGRPACASWVKPGAAAWPWRAREVQKGDPMSAPLIAIALELGLPIVEKILSKKIGDKNGELAADVIRTIAQRAGVGPADLDGLAETDPGRVGDAMRVVEHMSPELLALYAADQQYQLALLQAENGEGLFMRAWRPAGMWMILFLWLWNSVLLHGLNAFCRIALPPIPFQDLMALTALYFTLYMGGHTLKDVVKNWAAK